MRFQAFNLTVKNDVISSNFTNETFTYYKTLVGANAADAAQLITTPLAFTNTTAGTMPIWTRVENSNGCFRIAQITLQVLATNIPSTYNIQVQPVCDDLLDSNGNNTANNDKRDGMRLLILAQQKQQSKIFCQQRLEWFTTSTIIEIEPMPWQNLT